MVTKLFFLVIHFKYTEPDFKKKTEYLYAIIILSEYCLGDDTFPL